VKGRSPSDDAHPDWCTCIPCESARAAAVLAVPVAEAEDEPEALADVVAKPAAAGKPGRRKCEVRAVTIHVSRISQSARAAESALYPEAAHRRLPMLRGDCVDGERPCPYVSCAHHLFLDALPTGSIKINFPHLLEEDGGIRFEEMAATCALDVADAGGASLERVGEVMNLTREAVRLVEVQMWPKVKAAARRLGMEAA